MKRVLTQWGVGAFLAVLLVGCAATPPRWQYDVGGKRVEQKRYARYFAVDYMTRFVHRAYYKVEKPLPGVLSDDQRQYISRNGQPDYRRRPFRSREGERVEEWAYLAQDKLVQFVKGHVVYEGEVTDMEKTLIRLGYPEGCILGQREPGVEGVTFVYRTPADLQSEIYVFANGKLVFRQVQR